MRCEQRMVRRAIKSRELEAALIGGKRPVAESISAVPPQPPVLA